MEKLIQSIMIFAQSIRGHKHFKHLQRIFCWLAHTVFSKTDFITRGKILHALKSCYKNSVHGMRAQNVLIKSRIWINGRA